MRVLSLALIVGFTALAGCLQGDETDSGAPAPPPDSPSFDHSSATWPTGEAARGYIESYVMTHPFRVQQTGFESYMDAARVDLAALLEADGLDVVLHEYDGGINVLGVQNGTVHPDQWVVLSAHYDTVGAGSIGPTVYGAWDDGAGVGALLALAETLSTWEFPFTVVYAFFDGEEKGLVGSSQFVQTYFQDGTHDLVANINMDPPGLNWPCGDQTGPFPVKIIHEDAKVAEGGRYGWLFDAMEVGLNVSTVPEDVRDYTPGIPIATVGGTGLTGGSDHMSFGEVGVANVFLGGTPTTDTGAAAALTYPLHTPLDTLQAMDARCQTGSLAEGLHTTVTTVAAMLDWMSSNPAPSA